MDNSVRRLLEQLEPMIFDLDTEKRALEGRKKELENVSRLLAYTKDNLDMVGIYADQDLIVNNLTKVNSNKEEYRGVRLRRAVPRLSDRFDRLARLVRCRKGTLRHSLPRPALHVGAVRKSPSSRCGAYERWRRDDM